MPMLTGAVAAAPTVTFHIFTVQGERKTSLIYHQRNKNKSNSILLHTASQRIRRRRRTNRWSIKKKEKKREARQRRMNKGGRVRASSAGGRATSNAPSPYRSRIFKQKERKRKKKKGETTQKNRGIVVQLIRRPDRRIFEGPAWPCARQKSTNRK